MKHWDGRDLAQSIPLWLPQGEEDALARELRQPVRRRRRQAPHVASMVGLVLAVAVLAGLALALSPVDPVSSSVAPRP